MINPRGTATQYSLFADIYRMLRKARRDCMADARKDRQARLKSKSTEMINRLFAAIGMTEEEFRRLTEGAGESGSGRRPAKD